MAMPATSSSSGEDVRTARECVMSDHVWVSRAIADVSLVGKFDTDIWVENQQVAIQAEKLNKRGQPVAENMCPKKIWGDDLAPHFTTIPHLTSAQSHWIVSAKAAEVLRQFDLGGGALYSVADGIFQKDGVTRVPGDYFCWIFGNSKKAFLEQHSPAAKPMSGATTRDWCVMPSNLADKDIAVSTAALVGPDVWVDPLLFQSLFVSGRLGDALDAAGLRKAFRLFQCRVV
jgi:hypothetical protein